ncbi:MAG: MFS transporter, partial [Chloroflexota bacterium]
NYTLGTIIVLVGTVALFGPGFLLPQYLQGLRSQTPFEAGLLLLWGGIGAVGGSVLSGQLYNRLGPKVLIWIGLTDLFITSILLTLWTTATSDLNLLIPIMLVRGLGLPMMLQSVNTIALDGIRGPNLPDATTLNVVTRNIMGSLSIAILTNYLQSRNTVHISALAHGVAGRFAHTGVGGITGKQMPVPVQHALAQAYQDTFVLVTILVLPAFLVVGFLRQPSWRATTAAPGAAPSVPSEETERPAAVGMD